jgi:hypothetical protein
LTTAIFDGLDAVLCRDLDGSADCIRIAPNILPGEAYRERACVLRHHKRLRVSVRDRNHPRGLQRIFAEDFLVGPQFRTNGAIRHPVLEDSCASHDRIRRDETFVSVCDLAGQTEAVIAHDLISAMKEAESDFFSAASKAMLLWS